MYLQIMDIVTGDNMWAALNVSAGASWSLNFLSKPEIWIKT